MKQTLKTLTLLLCATILVACQQAGEKQDKAIKEKTSQSSSSSVSSSSSEQVQAMKKPDEELYASVLSSYRTEYQVDKHAFYDIDGNGVNEMVVGNGEFASAVYALNGETPELVVTSFVASAGGHRQSFTIFQDGKILFLSWHSLSSDATAKVFQLRKDNTGFDVILEQGYHLQNSKPADVGIDEGTELDLKSLTWQDAPLPPVVPMDINAIQAGDFSSVVGTWQSASGRSLTFDATGLVPSEGYEQSIGNMTLEAGILHASVSTGNYGYMMKFAPQGATYPTGVDNQPDASDNTRDRIWTGQQGVYSDPNEFFYRVE